MLVAHDPRRVAFCQALADGRQPMRLEVDVVLLDELPIAGAVTGGIAGVMDGLET